MEPFEDEQKESAAAAEVENALRRATMHFQVLPSLAINAQPTFDLGIFGAGIAPLNFEEPLFIYSGKHRPKRQPKDGTPSPPPAAAISFAARELGKLSMQFHSSVSAISRINPGPR